MQTLPLGQAGHAALPAPRLVTTTAGPVEIIDTDNGPALLALHGGMGGCDQSWLLARAILPDMAGFRIIAMSRPGYLGTPQKAGATPEAQADACAALLDSLSIGTAIVAAVSAGGPTAMQFALRHPDRCRALILVSTPSGPLETAAAFLARLRKLGWLSRVPGLIGLLRRKTAKDPHATALRSIRTPEIVDRTLAHPAAGPLFLAHQASAFSRPHQRIPATLVDTTHLQTMPTPDLASVTAPVLVIHGSADPVVPIGHAQRLLAQVSGAQGLILPGAGHIALFSHIDEVRQAVARFLGSLAK